MARFVHTPNVFQWVAFIQFVYPLHPGSNCFCRQVSGLANVAQWSEVLKSWKLLFWSCSFIATTSSWHGNILIKSHLSCGTCHGVYVTLIFHKPFGVVLKFSFHSLKYLLQLSFRSCKYLLVSYIQVLDFFCAKSKNLIISSNVKFSLQVYQQAAASIASTLPVLNYVSWLWRANRFSFQNKTVEL